MKRDKKSLGLEVTMGGNLKVQNSTNFALKGDINMSTRLLALLNKMGLLRGRTELWLSLPVPCSMNTPYPNIYGLRR